jgi:acyl carrier protein
MSVDVRDIRSQVKEIIGAVSDLDPGTIGDAASLVDDLGLDSLSLLEISVDVDYHFKLGLPEEAMKDLRTLQEIVDLVVERLTRRATAG